MATMMPAADVRASAPVSKIEPRRSLLSCRYVTCMLAVVVALIVGHVLQSKTIEAASMNELMIVRHQQYVALRSELDETNKQLVATKMMLTNIISMASIEKSDV